MCEDYYHYHLALLKTFFFTQLFSFWPCDSDRSLIAFSHLHVHYWCSCTWRSLRGAPEHPTQTRCLYSSRQVMVLCAPLFPRQSNWAKKEVKISLPVIGAWSPKLAGSGIPLAACTNLYFQWQIPEHSDGFGLESAQDHSSGSATHSRFCSQALLCGCLVQDVLCLCL